MVRKLPMKPSEALRAATYNAARATGLGSAFGRVSLGYRANLVLLDGNPLEDISATRNIVGIVLRGKLYEEQALHDLRRATRRTMQAGGQCTAHS